MTLDFEVNGATVDDLRVAVDVVMAKVAPGRPFTIVAFRARPGVVAEGSVLVWTADVTTTVPHGVYA